MTENCANNGIVEKVKDKDNKSQKNNPGTGPKQDHGCVKQSKPGFVEGKRRRGATQDNI